MSRSLLPVCLVVLACAGSDATAPAPGPEERFLTVTGVVRDSILGQPVAGVRVVAGDSSSVTGADGAFALTLAQGRRTLQAAPFAYEPLQINIDLNTPRSLVQLLRRQAPAIIACVITPAGLTSWMVDLQGRKTVDRRFATSVDVEGSSGTVQLLGHDLEWYPVNDLAWQVDLPGPGVSRADVVWHLADADGFRGTRRCSDAPAQAPASF